jgi:adenylate kinase
LKHLIFLGPPGVGKGTMAEKLTQNFPLRHISTGDILRAEMKGGSELGAQAKNYMGKGQLVPDELVAAIVATRLAEPESRDNGFILDGFPRTINQAKLLESALDKNKMKLDAVVLFEAVREILLKRLTARRICRECGAVFNLLFSPPEKDGICDKCGGKLYQRPDDSLDTAKNRLEVYAEQTAPLIDYYDERGLLLRVSGASEKAQNYRGLIKALKT